MKLTSPVINCITHQQNEKVRALQAKNYQLSAVTVTVTDRFGYMATVDPEGKVTWSGAPNNISKNTTGEF